MRLWIVLISRYGSSSLTVPMLGVSSKSRVADMYVSKHRHRHVKIVHL